MDWEIGLTEGKRTGLAVPCRRNPAGGGRRSVIRKRRKGYIPLGEEKVKKSICISTAPWMAVRGELFVITFHPMWHCYEDRIPKDTVPDAD